MPRPAFSYGRDVPEKLSQKLKEPARSLVVIGSSTGGVPVVRDILNSLRRMRPPSWWAQHMPRDYTGSFAESCNIEALIYAPRPPTDPDYTRASPSSYRETATGSFAGTETASAWSSTVMSR
jgi:hypothetical protein